MRVSIWQCWLYERWAPTDPSGHDASGLFSSSEKGWSLWWWRHTLSPLTFTALGSFYLGESTEIHWFSIHPMAIIYAYYILYYYKSKDCLGAQPPCTIDLTHLCASPIQCLSPVPLDCQWPPDLRPLLNTVNSTAAPAPPQWRRSNTWRRKSSSP